jgi:predicted ATPase/DNA-binding SARP family transcriptional activator
MLGIKTFGGISILKDGVEIKDLGSRKAEALLVYLAVEGGQHPRTVLAAMFWPESSEERAARSLRVTLSALRKIFDSYLEISRTSAGIKNTAAIQVDVLELEERLSSNNIDLALELYHGDFLSGFHIPDSLEFEDWRLLEQERYRRLVSEALHASISSKLNHGEIPAGLELSRHLLKLDPLDELAHQQHMMLLALDGQRSAALFQYAQFSKLLQSELGVEPSEATQDLFYQISSGVRLSKAISIQPKHNLPAQHTSFIGREKELAQIGKMMEDPHCRLITLTGPGGIGKTRLALQVASAFLHSFEDGTYFVPLGSIQSPDAILPTIAHTLSFSYDIATTLDPKSQLLDYLRHRAILLVMDGFEHLIQSTEMLSEMLEHVADLKLLLTSRERLGLQAEWAFQLEGLPIAENAQASDAKDTSALALFNERARQAKADFQLTGIDRQHAIRICQLVEGMPLGIELAAVWVSVLSCEEIGEEMEKSLDFLSASMRDLSMKHRSLRTAFDHSWRLLSEEQQEILCMLSVFRGPFSRSAAFQIVGANLTQLSSLIGKSLLRRNALGQFEMHELLRQYAAEKLDEKPGMKEKVQGRHADYYIELLCQRESELMGSRMSRVKAELHSEIGNIRTAANWAIQKRDAEAALKALERYFNFYAVQGWHEGKEAFESLAVEVAKTGLKQGHLVPQQNPVYLSIRAHQAFFCCNLGLIDESEAFSQECLAPLRQLKMQNELSICLHNLGVNDCFRGDYKRSIQRLEEAIELGKKFQTIAWRSYFLWLGYVYFMIGEYEQGMESLQTCYDLFEEIGSLWGEAFALSKMGLAADGLKDYTQALHYHQQAVSIFETTGDQAGKGYALSRMSMGAHLIDKHEDALRLGQEGYDAFKEIGHRWGICISLCRLGFAHLGLGEILKAKDRLYEALLLAQENQMTPLILHALAGLACALAMEGKTQRSLKMYQLVQCHPQTPAIYLEMAERWFSKLDLLPLPDTPVVSEAKDSDETLDQAVASILRERNG